jgi:hypothetical protein
MKLKQAIETLKKERRYPSNSYEWYRKDAKKRKRVMLGDVDAPVFLDRGTWCIEDGVFSMAIKKHREHLGLIEKNTKDLARRIIHGKDGDTVETEMGGYAIHGKFRFVWNDYEVARHKSEGTWFCNKCNIPAEEEHNNPECHLCSDWNGCGKDCTLSKVLCRKCGATLKI